MSSSLQPSAHPLKTYWRSLFCLAALLIAMLLTLQNLRGSLWRHDVACKAADFREQEGNAFRYPLKKRETWIPRRFESNITLLEGGIALEEKTSRHGNSISSSGWYAWTNSNLWISFKTGKPQDFVARVPILVPWHLSLLAYAAAVLGIVTAARSTCDRNFWIKSNQLVLQSVLRGCAPNVSPKPLSAGVVLLFLGVLSVFFYWKTGLFTSGFRYFIDDHQIPTIQHDLETMSLASTITSWIQFDQSILRFRPVYYLHLILQTIIFGITPVFWYAYLCVLSALTAFALYLYGRLLNWTALLALLFSSLVLWGQQSEIWARPCLPEAPAIFFFSIALLASAGAVRSSRFRRQLDATMVTTMILSSLCKETFILLIPALLLQKVLFERHLNHLSWTDALRKNRLVIMLLTLVAAAEIAYIKIYIGTAATGYAGFDENNMKLSKLAQTAWVLARESSALFLILAAGALCFAALRRRQSVPTLHVLLPSILVFIAICAPQILIYAKSRIDGYYLIPGTLGFAFLTTTILHLLNQQAPLLGKILITAGIGVVLTRYPVMEKTCSAIAEDSQQMNAFLEHVVTQTPPDEPILIVLNPRIRFEVAHSLKRIFNNAYHRDDLYLATFGSERSDYFSEKFASTEQQWSFLDPGKLSALYENKKLSSIADKVKLPTIIVFDELSPDFIRNTSDWFHESNYLVRDFEISFAPVRVYSKTQ